MTPLDAVDISYWLSNGPLYERLCVCVCVCVCVYIKNCKCYNQCKELYKIKLTVMSNKSGSLNDLATPCIPQKKTLTFMLCLELRTTVNHRLTESSLPFQFFTSSLNMNLRLEICIVSCTLSFIVYCCVFCVT